MVMGTTKPADNINDQIGEVVENLTHVVEKEVRAFQTLLKALMEQQSSIIKGDADSVSESNEQVERIVQKTKALERERRGKSQSLSKALNVHSELTLSQLIPLVEDKYAVRLEELKEMLLALSSKIKDTNQRNRYLLEHSLKFVDHCINLLTPRHSGTNAYNRGGKITIGGSPLYHRIG